MFTPSCDSVCLQDHASAASVAPLHCCISDAAHTHTASTLTVMVLRLSIPHRFLQDSSSYVLYPFGYGLSYTTFTYSGLRVVPSGSEGCLNPGEGPAMCVAVTVTNTGGTGFKKPAEHAVPLYLTHMTLSVRDHSGRRAGKRDVVVGVVERKECMAAKPATNAAASCPCTTSPAT